MTVRNNFFFFGSDMFREVHAVHGLKRKYVGRYRVIVELQGDCGVRLRRTDRI